MHVDRAVEWVRIWIAFVKVGVRRSLFYPLDMIGQFIALLTYLAIHMLLLSNAERDLIAGIELWIHVCLFFAVVQFPAAGLFTFDIRSGRIMLVETLPVRHLHRLHGQYFGQRAPSVILVLSVFCMLANVSDMSIYQILYLFLGLATSFSFALLFHSLVGLAAFSVPYVLGVGELKAAAMLIFSGIIIPVDDLPLGLELVAYCTPFPWLVYKPAMAVAEGAGMPSVVLIQLIWMAALFLAFRVLEAKVRGRHRTFGG